MKWLFSIWFFIGALYLLIEDIKTCIARKDSWRDYFDAQVLLDIFIGGLIGPVFILMFLANWINDSTSWLSYKPFRKRKRPKPHCPDCKEKMAKSWIECEDGSGWYCGWLCGCKKSDE